MLTWQLHCGDALSVLKTLPDQSVNCCVTSPPYFNLRDYQTATWEGGSASCDHLTDAVAVSTKSTLYSPGEREPSAAAQKYGSQIRKQFMGECAKCWAVRSDRQIGAESSPQEYVAAIVEVFAECRRVLVDNGTLWVNVGDSYNNRCVARQSSHQTGLGFDSVDLRQSWRELTESGRTRLSLTSDGLKEKDLLGIPWSVAFALRNDGWYLRADIVWGKVNPMPESVTDRPTKSHEYVFLLTKSARYWYDAEAIREKSLTGDMRRPYGSEGAWQLDGRPSEQRHGGEPRKPYTGKATKDYESGGAQDPSATKARIVEAQMSGELVGRNCRSVWMFPTEPSGFEHFAVMPRALARRCIVAGCPFGGVVLDMFAGVCTTGVVALEEGRNFVGVELNSKYHAIGRERLANVAPLLAQEIAS